ncbi:Protein of unknown function (DUF2537) [Streptoalloteichus tenebrarius]|uniref:DUF2537 domain-containing protein n=1 Tax=Streptoalloteichus tenebrarius (strain ATCC 17920 / DSM 40477 / JCM 4838 / CBS 697.72 / NBRC 16177 / NCIMB 11028 / NRRL B-12390 / A12253. 1 / ISP 5477) TaxID=1933 RepID=A0ABT1HVP5_STRSD|nr:Protein of unknown function (DUF2537) [Streptoalloteichus tenebrarius]
MVVGERDGVVHEVDPDSLALPSGLATALHEWAQVVAAVSGSGAAPGETTAELVSRRGRQLAGRLAQAMGTPVDYADPLRGGLERVEAPPRPVRNEPAPAPPPSVPTEPAEPTPWATGLTVSALTAAVVATAVVGLTLALAETRWWLGLVANLVVVGGLAPSVWLTRELPVWRWVAYGVAAGLGAAWFALALSLLG